MRCSTSLFCRISNSLSNMQVSFLRPGFLTKLTEYSMPTKGSRERPSLNTSLQLGQGQKTMGFYLLGNEGIGRGIAR